MVEMMLSHEMLAWITGDLTWADRCEDVAFNYVPGGADRRPQGPALPHRAEPCRCRTAQNKAPGRPERRRDVR